MNIRPHFHPFLPLLAAFWLTAHAAHAAEGDASRLPRQELTPQTLFQFLLAEIAGPRGETGLAVETYRDLARSTRDPRVARRAAEIAYYARHYDAAIEAARLWAEIDPESAQARQMVTGLLAAAGRIEELADTLSRQFATEAARGTQAGSGLAASLMLLNRQLARLSDKQAALRLVERLSAPYAGVAEARFAHAQAAHNAGDRTLALSEMDEALALRPDWEQAALMRAQFSGSGAAALDFLGRFLADHPKAREVRLAHARLLVGERRYAEARRAFAELLAAAPDDADAIYAVAILSLQLNDLKEAETHLKRLIELNFQEINAVRLYLGQIAEEGKRWDEALQWYGQVAPGAQYLPARLRIAQVLMRQGKLDEARRRLQETAADPRERAQLLIGEAQLLREVGRHADVFAVLDGGLAAQPDQPELLYETALAAERVGRIEQMERNLRRLIELKPDHAHAYNALGYSMVDRNVRLDEAQALIEKAVQLSPQDPYILDSKGWLLFRRGDTAGALEILRRALALRADPEIAAHLGEVLWTAGQRDEARKTWEDALKASPANAANETLLGTIRKFHP